MARKILLADDSVTAQNMGRRILSDAGYEVITVNNGSAALKRIAESKPDLIVLDVYMPGYGGLEVCQRLRESAETARIPVLLTVGKLEPFKPEEARRVRADAFIVKPFEASELLTALTKLEDRIVPPPQPSKPGRFAKAMSSIESGMPSVEYGDLEKGWKNRLKIPLPVPESHGPELEIGEQAQPAESENGAGQKPMEVPAGVPGDITPEEIAAINAAAAAFGAQPGGLAEAETKTVPASELTRKEEATPEAPTETRDEVAATFASAASAVETQIKPERVDGPTVVEPAKSEDKGEDANAAPTGRAEPPAPAQEVASAPLVEVRPKAAAGDDFAAALESLAPTSSEMPPQPSGPRWAAAPVAITDAESGLVLEQEMQKAVSAMAAMNAAETSASSVDQEAPPEVATSLVAAMVNQTTLADLVDAAMPRASALNASPESQGAAFAAAAGTGDSIATSSVPADAAQTAGERERESELAAAWESWKHIRESVVEPQLKSQAADVAAEPPAASADQISAPPSETEGDADSQEEAGAIASIVDSVLADLKPKLMEEISKKMSKEKKRK